MALRLLLVTLRGVRRRNSCASASIVSASVFLSSAVRCSTIVSADIPSSCALMDASSAALAAASAPSAAIAVSELAPKSSATLSDAARALVAAVRAATAVSPQEHRPSGQCPSGGVGHHRRVARQNARASPSGAGAVSGTAIRCGSGQGPGDLPAACSDPDRLSGAAALVRRNPRHRGTPTHRPTPREGGVGQRGKITIRHSISIWGSPGGGPDPSKPGADSTEGERCLLRSGRPHAPLGSASDRLVHSALFEHPRFQPFVDHAPYDAVLDPQVEE